MNRNILHHKISNCKLKNSLGIFKHLWVLWTIYYLKNITCNLRWQIAFKHLYNNVKTQIYGSIDEHHFINYQTSSFMKIKDCCLSLLIVHGHLPLIIRSNRTILCQYRTWQKFWVSFFEILSKTKTSIFHINDRSFFHTFTRIICLMCVHFSINLLSCSLQT